MAFTKLTKSVLNVSALPDRVNNQSQLLKATFDQAGVDIKEAHNTLIDELEAVTSAEMLGAKTQTGEQSTIQNELNNIFTSITGKVEKIEGKQLSTEDYTTEEKEKLENIEANANNYTLPEASTTILGGIKVDGSTIVVENGVAKAKAADAADYTARAEIEVLKETKADKVHVHSASEITEGTLAGKVIANATAVEDYGTSQIRNIKASTTDLTDGSSTLATGDIYLVYE